MTYDALVCGAGTAGCIAAYFAAKKGLKVCLIDSKPKHSVGTKICGDAVGKDIFSFLQIAPPSTSIILRNIEGGNLYSPSGTKIPLKDPKQAGYILDRLRFGQWLLDFALKNTSITFMDSTTIISTIIKNNAVVGVLCRDKKAKKDLELYAPIVIDSTGYTTPLRRMIQAPENEPNFDQTNDNIICYREICEISDSAFSHGENSHLIGIYLDPEKSPGGYIWYFPRTENSVNIGIGIYPHLKNSVKPFFDRYVNQRFLGRYSNIKVISTGGGIVSVRRPIFSSVNDGILFAGDAGLHVNPIHGGGIDSSMRAGYYAALTALESHEQGKFDKKALWPYNLRLNKAFGKSFTSLHVIRMALQRFGAQALDFGIRNNFLSAKEILYITATGDLPLDPLSGLQKLSIGLFQPKFLLDFAYIYSQMGKVARHYDKYPESPELINRWMKITTGIFERIKGMLNSEETKRKDAKIS